MYPCEFATLAERSKHRQNTTEQVRHPVRRRSRLRRPTLVTLVLVPGTGSAEPGKYPMGARGKSRTWFVLALQGVISDDDRPRADG